MDPFSHDPSHSEMISYRSPRGNEDGDPSQNLQEARLSEQSNSTIRIRNSQVANILTDSNDHQEVVALLLFGSRIGSVSRPDRRPSTSSAEGSEREENRTGNENFEITKTINGTEDRDPNENRESLFSKAKVTVRTLLDSNLAIDGCQWRKYGQKKAKGNPFPRAYYRCTMSERCPVRKKVQKLAENRRVVVSIYEAIHNHPLPPRAAFTFNAIQSAISIFSSGSVATTQYLTLNSSPFPSFPPTTIAATLTSLKPLPTITLDLTQIPDPVLFAQPRADFYSLPAIQPPSMVEGRDLLQLSPLAPSAMETVTANIKADPRFNEVIVSAIALTLRTQRNSIDEGASSSNSHSSSVIPPNVLNLDLNLFKD